MKKYCIIIFYIFLFMFVFSIDKVFAIVNYTFNEETFHVVWVKNNASSTTCDNVSTITYDENNIEYIQSFNTYDEALTYLNTLTSTDEKVASIVGEKKDKIGTYVNTILYAAYGLVDLNTANTTQVISNVYSTATNNSAYTYINGHGMFGAVDAALINYNNGTTRANIKIAGVDGWINSLLYFSASTYNGYDIVPLSSVKSPSYYYVNDNGELVHRLSRKITSDNCYVHDVDDGIKLGPAPSSLSKNDINGNRINYYSYDGLYFYTSLITMLDDYKSGTTINAINKVPYYNYYMYLPVRTKTNITSDDLRNYLESRNYTSSTSSALYGNELAFIDAENKFGVNALISFSTAIHESWWGTSTLALTKKNLFGHNAIDSDVMNAASGYNNVSDGIYRHAYYLINAGFSETKDAVARYYGSNLGNKNSGMNVKYASDPYWGEKIASYYYSIDNYNGLKDYYKYAIGIKVSNIDVPVKKEANTTSTTLYKLESYNFSVTNMPVIILERVVGESINGNNIWYKIQSDALLDSDRENVIQDTGISDLYDWNNNYGYVHSSYITLMDENVQNVYTIRDGMFGLESLSLNDDNTVNITGYLTITGIDNSKDSNITYDLVLQNETTNEVFELPLDRILDESKMPYTILNIDKYDYSYSWFSGNVDLSIVSEGNYIIYVRARNKEYESKEILSNMLSKKILSKYTDSNGRGYQFRTNYYLRTVPIELFIRDDGLISSENAPTADNMFNQYQSIELKDGNLILTGSSFNVGGNYSTEINVERKIVFENVDTFERYEYDLSYIDTGEYEITLIVPDNLSKTRAWFSKSVSLSEIKKGTYAIYIKTKSNIEDAGELNDIFNRTIESSTTVGDNKVSISINKNQRFRLELNIK